MELKETIKSLNPIGLHNNPDYGVYLLHPIDSLLEFISFLLFIKLRPLNAVGDLTNTKKFSNKKKTTKSIAHKVYISRNRTETRIAI